MLASISDSKSNKNLKHSNNFKPELLNQFVLCTGDGTICLICEGLLEDLVYTKPILQLVSLVCVLEYLSRSSDSHVTSSFLLFFFIYKSFACNAWIQE